MIKVSDDPAVDFVDRVIGKISLKGPLPPGRPVDGLINSVAKDLKSASGTDTLVVDLYGLSAADAERVRSAVTALHGQNPTKKLPFLLEAP
jgi:hypothetical protein